MDSLVSLTKEALKLSPQEKAQLIDSLWQSLDPIDQVSVDRAWIEESLARLKAYREGNLQAVDGSEALESIERGIGQ